MPKYDFVVKGPNVKINHPQRAYLDEKNPRLKISHSGVFIPEVIYAEINRPERTVIAVDEAHKALKVEESRFGYKVKKLTYSDGSNYYQLITTQPMKRRSLEYYVGKLPLGLYKSIGGNVFEFDRSEKLNKK